MATISLKFWLVVVSKLRSQLGSGRQNAPNKVCSGFVGVYAVYKHLSGFEFFVLSSRVHARLSASNANCWAACIANGGAKIKNISRTVEFANPSIYSNLNKESKNGIHKRNIRNKKESC